MPRRDGQPTPDELTRRRTPPPGGGLPPPEAAQAALAATHRAAQVAGAAQPVVGPVLTIAAVNAAAAGILGAFDRFLQTRRTDQESYVNDLLEAEVPDLPADSRVELVAGEMDAERAFATKSRARLDRDLPKALSIADPTVREAEVQKILDRERRYAEMRESAMATRTLGMAEQRRVEKLSPEGGFWRLSPHVREHTLDCLAMGNKVWPHSVLRHYHPPLHGGCPCELWTISEAENAGLLHHPSQYATPDQSLQAMQVVEADVDVEEFAAELEALEAVYDERWGKGTTKAGQFRPKRGGDPGAVLRHSRLSRMRLPSLGPEPVRALHRELDVRHLNTHEIQPGDHVMVNGNLERVEQTHPDKPGLLHLEHTGLVYIDRPTIQGIPGAGAPAGPEGHPEPRTGVRAEDFEPGTLQTYATLRQHHAWVLGLTPTGRAEALRDAQDASTGAVRRLDLRTYQRTADTRAVLRAHMAMERDTRLAQRRAQAREEHERTGKLTVSEDEFRKLVGSPGDAYHDAGYKGEYNPDLFLTSDLTGRKIRHYVKLPDGRLAHPDELKEARTRRRLIVVKDDMLPPLPHPEARTPEDLGVPIPEPGGKITHDPEGVAFLHKLKVTDVPAHEVPEPVRHVAERGISGGKGGLVSMGAQHVLAHPRGRTGMNDTPMDTLTSRALEHGNGVAWLPITDHNGTRWRKVEHAHQAAEPAPSEGDHVARLAHASTVAWDAMVRTGPHGSGLERERYRDPENPASKPSVLWALTKHASKLRSTQLNDEYAKRADAKQRHAAAALDAAKQDLEKNIAHLELDRGGHDEALRELRAVHAAVTGAPTPEPGDHHGLPELPHFGPDDRYELRHGPNGSLIMWDRETNKPHAIWDHGWNLDDVVAGVHQDNEAHRAKLASREPAPPSPTGGPSFADVERELLTRKMGKAGEARPIMRGIHYDGPSDGGKPSYKHEVHGDTLHLQQGFFRQGRDRREAIVFKHLGSHLADALGEHGIARLGEQDSHLANRQNVIDTYFALNTPARDQMTTLHPEAARLVAQAAHEHGLPLHPEAAKLVRAPSVQDSTPAEHPAHALAKSVVGLNDTEANDRLTAAGYHYSSSSKGPDGVLSLHYRNHEQGSTVIAAHGPGGVTEARADIHAEVPEGEARPMLGIGHQALAEHMREQGYSPGYTTIHDASGHDWMQFVHPDGRGRAIRLADNLKTDKVTAFTPTDSEVRAAHNTLMSFDPLRVIKPGDDAQPVIDALDHVNSPWMMTAQGTSAELGSGSLPAGVDSYVRFTRAHSDKPNEQLVLHLREKAGGGREIVAVGHGSLVHPHQIPTPDQLEAEKQAWHDARARAEADRQEAERKRAAASEGLKAAAEAGDSKQLHTLLAGRTVNEAVRIMQGHGFELRGRRRGGRGADRTITYTLRGPGGSTIKLTGRSTYASQDITKVQAEGNPQGGDRTRLPAGQAPRNADELLRDALGRADELGQRYDAGVHVSAIIQSGVSRGAAAHHEWNGTIAMRKGVEMKVIRDYLAKRNKGEPLSERDHLRYYNAVQILQHEINHGVAKRGDGPGGLSFKRSDYGGLGKNIEEALTEETAHLLAADWLRSHGMTDVLAAVKRNPDSVYVQGTYQDYRVQLRRALEQSGVPEAQWPALLERMKFQMTPQERNALLTELTHTDNLSHAIFGIPGREEAARRREMRSNFQPVVRADLSDIHAPVLPLKIAGGREVTTGDHVTVDTSDGPVTGEVTKAPAGGDVVKVLTEDGLDLWRSVDRVH